VTLTGLGRGSCLLLASVGQFGTGAIVSIPPLAPGDPCASDLQCGQAAPTCGFAIHHCGKTCTQACSTDADCPVRDAYWRHVSCNGQLCVLVRDPDWTCP
jgi:hypothetical protein